MKEGGGGSIIMVSSIAGALGLIGSPGAVAYATAKAGLHGFTMSVAADYATQNIRANCIVVGSVHTPMVAHMGAEARERRRNMVPMKTEGTAWDIAHGAVYLASDELRWVTGLTAADRRRAGGAAAVAALAYVRAGGASLQSASQSGDLAATKTERPWSAALPAMNDGLSMSVQPPVVVPGVEPARHDDRRARERPIVGNVAEHDGAQDRHPDQQGVAVGLHGAGLGMVERLDQRVVRQRAQQRGRDQQRPR